MPILFDKYGINEWYAYDRSICKKLPTRHCHAFLTYFGECMLNNCSAVKLIGGIGISINDAIEFCIEKLHIPKQDLILYTPEEVGKNCIKSREHFCGKI